MASSKPDDRPITPTGNISEIISPVTTQKISEPESTFKDDPDRLSRPRSISRKSSGPLVVARSEPDVKTHTEYPPDDARGMSPRRSSAECDEMTMQTRASIRQYVLPLFSRRWDLEQGITALHLSLQQTGAPSSHYLLL